MRLIPLLMVVVSGLVTAMPARAAEPSAKKKDPAASTSRKEQPPADAAGKGGGTSASTPPQNACGCYEDSSGMCHCAKQSRCGCPGECEPNGCEDKRRKEMAKEEQQELKRQRDEDKKRNAELSKKRDDDERKESQKRERNLRGLRLVEPNK